MVNNDPILALLLKRLRTIKNVDQVILATTTNNSDNVLVEMANNLGIKTYRGDEFDVLNAIIFESATMKTFFADSYELKDNNTIVSMGKMRYIINNFFVNCLLRASNVIIIKSKTNKKCF